MFTTRSNIWVVTSFDSTTIFSHISNPLDCYYRIKYKLRGWDEAISSTMDGLQCFIHGLLDLAGCLIQSTEHVMKDNAA